MGQKDSQEAPLPLTDSWGSLHWCRAIDEPLWSRGPASELREGPTCPEGESLSQPAHPQMKGPYVKYWDPARDGEVQRREAGKEDQCGLAEPQSTGGCATEGKGNRQARD